MSDINLSVFLGLLCSAFFLTIIGIKLYKSLAIKYGVVAKKNFRTLHEVDVPKGSGVVFSLVFIACIIVLYYLNLISSDIAIAICLGGFIATLFGFFDDIFDIPAVAKFLVQIILSLFLIIWFGGFKVLLNIHGEPIGTSYIGIFFGAIFFTWFINAYNFMDGIDGMAASGAVFICFVISIVSLLYGYSDLSLITILLAVTCLAFLLFNWPSASIFMGDAGSVFLGYFFCTIIIFSMSNGYIELWTWIIVFGYFGIDTGVTLVTRILIVKKWYGAHRSHAYQNLARIWGSHRKVLNIVVSYHVFWILPLAILSVTHKEYQILSCILAVTPVVVWTLKYGPLLSSD